MSRMTKRAIKSFLIAGQIVLCLFVASLVTFFANEFIVKYRLDYNEAGRYFEEERALVFDEQAVSFYAFFLVVLSIVLIFLARWTISTIRKKEE